jgi:hypothetical protein
VLPAESVTLDRVIVALGIATKTTSKSPLLLEIVVTNVEAAAVSVLLADRTSVIVLLGAVPQPCRYQEVAA